MGFQCVELLMQREYFNVGDQTTRFTSWLLMQSGGVVVVGLNVLCLKWSVLRGNLCDCYASSVKSFSNPLHHLTPTGSKPKNYTTFYRKSFHSHDLGQIWSSLSPV